MKLLLDIGNTAVKWAMTEAGTFTAQGYFVHRDAEFERLAQQAWSALAAPERVVAVNVAGDEVATALGAYVTRAWDCPIEFVEARAADHGVINAYPVPGDLGADRWVAMIAAHHQVEGDACVFDCGTAITVDLVTASGEHRGGLILPGIDMLVEALQANTAGIQLPDMAGMTGLLGRGTREGVTGGAERLLAAALDRIAADIQADSDAAVSFISTGGDAERLLSHMKTTLQYEPQLVLQGLTIMSDRED